ncbi:hypothetical protein Btru_009781 [Bulinus truncatus]|nr:hypothetical protein Btru_009781 [Bulinus truncatus]
MDTCSFQTVSQDKNIRTLEPDHKVSIVPLKFITTLSIRLPLSNNTGTSVSFFAMPNCPQHKKHNTARQISQPCMGTSCSDQIACRAVYGRGCTSDDCKQHKPKEASTDLGRVKSLANRLKLSTRRQSYLSWLADGDVKRQLLHSVDVTEEGTNERREMSPNVKTLTSGESCGKEDDESSRINGLLDSIRSDLQNMKTQDQNLARQLLNLYQEMVNVRLSWSCQVHQELLDEVQSNIEELQELPNVLDLPSNFLDCPLKHVGVTRLNLSARRFSAC